jgi:accessory colonization factor AcfC
VATFSGISFSLLIAGHTYGAQAIVNVESLPEGSLIVVDIGGAGEERVSGTCLFSSFASLKAMINLARAGRQDILVYTEDTRNAILISCQRQQVLPRDKHIARCEWILEPE